jgi:hypothetical protein
MSSQNEHSIAAHTHAEQAAEVASRLKAGTWDAVQALASLSIAESLLAREADSHNS